MTDSRVGGDLGPDGLTATDSILIDPNDRGSIRIEAAPGTILVARENEVRPRITCTGKPRRPRESARDRIRSAVISARIKLVREECFGPDGIGILAACLGIDEETWSGYESWVTIPGPLLLEFIAITSVRPSWLLDGSEPRYGGSSA